MRFGMADLDDHEEDDSNMSNVVECDRGGSDSGAGATSVLPVGARKKQRKVLEFRAKMESEKIATTEVLKLRGRGYVSKRWRDGHDSLSGCRSVQRAFGDNIYGALLSIQCRGLLRFSRAAPPLAGHETHTGDGRVHLWRPVN